MIRRYRFVSLFLLLLTLLGLGLYFSARLLDPSDYRRLLQRELSKSLSAPVNIGRAEFSLRHGPSVALSDLRIGDEAAPFDLQAERIFLKIAAVPLLRGNVVFSTILLDSPRLHVQLSPRDPVVENLGKQTRMPVAFAGDTPVRIRRGAIVFDDFRDPDAPRTWKLHELDGRFDPSSGQEPGWLSLSGLLAQPGKPASIDMGGAVDFAGPGSPTGLDLGIRVDNLRPAPFLKWWLGPEANATGALSLNLILSGSPQEKLSFTLESGGMDLGLRFPGFPSHFAPENLRIGGAWKKESTEGSVADFSWQVDGFPGEGQLSFSGTGDSRRIEGLLSTPGLSLPDLLSLLSDGAPPFLAEVRKRLESGRITLEELSFSLPGSSDPMETGSLAWEGTLSVDDLELRGGETWMLTQGAFTAVLQKNLLRIEEGAVSSPGGPLRFEGAIEYPFRSPEIDFKLTGTQEAAWLKKWLPADLIRDLVFYGPTTLSLEAGGKPEKWTLALLGDLSEAKIGWKDIFRKPAGLEGKFQMRGVLSPEKLELVQGRIELPFMTLNARGNRSRDIKEDFRLTLEGAVPELSAARTEIPFLEEIRARGGIDLQYEVLGNKDGIEEHGGILSLEGTGISLPGGLSDLSGARGTVRLVDEGLHAEGVTALLGESPIFLNADLKDFSSPRLALEVRSDRIRADELIFDSPALFLHRIDGRLIVDRSGILFDKVSLRLEKGTVATVRGTLQGYSDPRVTLDIESARADIDDVIALWKKPENRRKKESTAASSSPSVVITARADRGVFWNMNFQEAEGRIRYRNGILSIEPLRFETGEGICTGAVTVRPGEEDASWLDISGKADGVSATILHHDLLKRRGIISGTLQGDFRLSGKVGSEFLDTSDGEFHLSVRQGVLRKFNFLSKVFSLLNVSQILTFQLPDMSTEGMPFQSLNGTFSLHEGILSTEDLLVESNAMDLSLVGSSDLKEDSLDLVMGVQPLGTVDKIVSRIPVAGWLLTGKDGALITALFRVSGPLGDPEVTPMPAASVSEKVLGVFQRVFHLPGHLIGDGNNEAPPSSEKNTNLPLHDNP